MQQFEYLLPNQSGLFADRRVCMVIIERFTYLYMQVQIITTNPLLRAGTITTRNRIIVSSCDRPTIIYHRSFVLKCKHSNFFSACTIPSLLTFQLKYCSVKFRFCLRKNSMKNVTHF